MPSAVRDDTRDDGDLVPAVRAGAVDALGELYRRYADTVYALAYRLIGSRADAEDVLQDVFVGLPRALRSYEERGRFEAWLKRVTARTALMRMRSNRRRREDPLEHVPAPVDAAADEPDPVDRIALRRALSALPASLRAVFVLKEIEGYSHAEIGEFLGISAGASAVRLSRAWKKLRRGMRR